MSAQLTERTTRLYWKSRCAASAASERKLYARIDARHLSNCGGLRQTLEPLFSGLLYILGSPYRSISPVVYIL